MSRVYQSVRGVVQGSLHRRKPDTVPPAQAKGHPGGLNDAIEEFEKSFLEGVSRLKAAVGDDQAVVASEAQHAEQMIEDLKANIAGIEAKLKEAEDTVHSKDLASQKIEESLRTEIRDLQSVVKNKEKALENQDSEVADLKSKVNILTEQGTRMGLAFQRAKAEAASAAEDAKQVIEGLKANIIVLEARLKETEDIVHRKEIATQEIEQTVRTEIRDLQNVVKNKEEAIESRDSEVTDLKSKIYVLAEQVNQLNLAVQEAKGAAATEVQHAEQVIESLKIEVAFLQDQLRQAEQIVGGTPPIITGFDENGSNEANDRNIDLETKTNGMEDSKAEASLDTPPQAIGTVLPDEKLETPEEKPNDFNFQAEGIASIVTESAHDTVSQDTFDRVIDEFSRFANVIESIASLIVRDHVRVLGESVEKYPKARLPELLESLSSEIADDNLKTAFCERFVQLQTLGEPSYSSSA